VNERTSVPAPAGVIDPANVHRSLLALVLRVSATLGGLVYVPSVYLSVKRGMVGAVVVDTGALAAVLALLRLDRLPFAWRAGTVCAVYYALGVGLLLQIGAISQIYLFGFSLVTVLLLGVRAGLCAALLSAASLFAIGLSGLAAPEVQAHGAPHDGYAWFVISLNFAFVNTLITLAVGVVLATVSDALAKEVSSRLGREHAEAERDRLLAQLQLQIERMPLAYLLTDENLAITGWNEAAERIFGFTEADVLGKHPLDFMVPDASRAAAASVFERLRAGSLEPLHEAENLHKGGTTITCEWYNMPMLGADGAFVGLLALAQDVTDRKKLEDQLRQSQKMDAIGQLAGGVAHDFNNLLSVVLSYSDMLLMDLKAEDPVRADIVEIRRAGQRASDLTRQLLMFSRQQVVEPRVLDLNEVLSGVDKMLRRLVGADVDIVSVPGSALGRVRADPGSLEQVLVNLAVNARDAMPTGGPAHDGDGQRHPRRGVRAEPPGRGARRVRHALRERHGYGYGQGDARAHLRAVLHDEGEGTRYGPRPVDRVRHREAERRIDMGVQRAGARYDLQGLPSPGRRRADRCRSRGGGRDPARNGDHLARRGRGSGARGHLRHPPEARLRGPRRP
jgi:PAS domain S-box-containing protein